MSEYNIHGPMLWRKIVSAVNSTSIVAFLFSTVRTFVEWKSPPNRAATSFGLNCQNLSKLQVCYYILPSRYTCIFISVKLK